MINRSNVLIWIQWKLRLFTRHQNHLMKMSSFIIAFLILQMNLCCILVWVMGNDWIVSWLIARYYLLIVEHNRFNLHFKRMIRKWILWVSIHNLIIRLTFTTICYWLLRLVDVLNCLILVNYPLHFNLISMRRWRIHHVKIVFIRILILFLLIQHFSIRLEIWL